MGTTTFIVFHYDCVFMLLMSSKITISVVIPCWNRKKLLRRAIESVCYQTTLPLELIVVDDGSTDCICQEVNQLIQRHHLLIRYHLIPINKGVAFARNEGVKVSRGTHIAFLDSDDQWLPFHLNRLIQYVKMNSFKIVQSDEIWIRSGKRVNVPHRYSKKMGYLFEDSLKRCVITPSCVLIEKKIFLLYGGFDVSYRVCEDYELWVRMTFKEPIGFLDKKTVIKYGKMHEQLSFSCTAMDQYRIRAMLSFFKQYFNELSSFQKRRLQIEIIHKIWILKKSGMKKNQSMRFYQETRTIYLSIIKTIDK